MGAKRLILVAATGFVMAAGGTTAVAASLPAVSRTGHLSGSALAGQASAARTTSRLATGSSADDWPELHRDPMLGGYAANGTVTTANAGTLGVHWATDLYGAVLDSPVIAYDSSLDETLGYVGTDQGNFYAVNMATGAIVWAANVGGPVRSSPLVSNGAVWLGTTLGTIYKLNASTGATECTHRNSGGSLLSSPVAATPPGGTASVYFAAGHVFSVSAATCALKWTFSGGHTGTWDPLAYTVDAAGKPLVLFGSNDPSDTAFAADAVTGKEVWHFKTANDNDFDLGSGFTISAPHVNGFADGVAYVPGKDGNVAALNLATGKRLWRTSLGTFDGVVNESLSTAALDGTNLVLGDAVGVVDLNAKTGKVVWRYNTPTTSAVVPRGPSEVIASPAISGPAGHEVVTFGDLGNAFRVLSLASGAQVYDYRTRSWVSGGPAVSGGDILVGSSDGFLYDFSAGSGNNRPATSISSPTFRTSVANPAGDLTVKGSASDSSGVAEVVTAVRQGGSGGTWWDAATSSWSAAPVTERATLTAAGATSSGWSVSFPVPPSGNAYRVDAYTVSAGGPSAVPAAQDEFFVRPESGGPSLSLSRGFVGPRGSVSVKGAGFGPSEKISVSLAGTVVGHATSLANGSIRAFKVRIPTVGFGPTALLATGTTSKKAAAAAIFITNAWPQLGDGPSRAGYEADDPLLTNTIDPGQEILSYPGWHFSAGAALTSPVVAGQVVYVGDQSGTLHALQAYNGTQLWSWHTPDGKAITGSPAVDPVAHLVFVGAADGKLYAISRSGKLAWSATIRSGNVQSPLLARGLVYAASTGGRMAALSKVTGSKVWSTSVGGITNAPAFGSSRGAILIPTKGSVTELSASTGALRWRFRVTRPTSPLVAGGDVYFGSTNHHVYAVSEATGRQIWTFTTRGVVRYPGALVRSVQTNGVGRLYIGSSNDKLYSFDASTGKMLAATPFGATVTGVAIAGNIVLVTTSSGLVEGMRIHGSFVWDDATGGGLLRPPALVDGTFYAAGAGRSMWAFTPYAAPPQ